MKVHRNEGLDALRTVAIAMVVGLHAGQLTAQSAPGFALATSYGWMGVDVFFVLSGFLIGRQFWTGEIDVGGFYLKRLSRTLPLYFIVLFFYVAIKPFFGFPFIGAPATFAVFAQNYQGVFDFVPSWSLCIEEQFYLIFPLVALAASRLRPPALAWLLPLAFSAAARYVYANRLGGVALSATAFCQEILFKTYLHLDGISTGLFLAATRATWERWTQKRRLSSAVGGSIILAGTAWYCASPWDGPGFVLCFSGLAIGVALLVPWLLEARLPPLVKLLTGRIALWSYGIYLWNDVVSRLMHHGPFSSLPWQGTIFVFGGLSLGVAVATYYAIERPALRWRDQVLGNERRIPSSATLEDFYRNDAYSGFGGQFSEAQHSDYGDFVNAHIRGQPLLEIGSGLGAAAYALHLRGVAVTASDIFPANARRKFEELGVAIEVVHLNATQNGLPDASVSNYALYQVLEHLADPAACFKHCYRTLKPGGRLVVVSPNLLSPLASAQAVFNGLTRRWPMPLIRRSDGYTFPFGNTVMGGLVILARNLALAVWLRTGSSGRVPRFRQPSFKKPALSDSDAIFLSEPLTVRALLEKAGFVIVSFQEPRRTGTWAGSVWIVAEKPPALAQILSKELAAEERLRPVQHQAEFEV